MVVPEAVWGAAYNGLLAPVQAWFDSGDRDANDLDQYRIPLLHRAFQSELFQTRWEAAKRADVVRYLVARGADVNRSSQLEFFNHHGSYLHIVTSRWAEEDVQLLLELGADIAAKDPLLLVGYRVSKSKTRPPTPRRRTRGTWEPFASARATRRRRRRPRGGAPCAAARWRLRVGRPVAATAKGIAAAPRIVRGAASDPSVADRRSDGSRTPVVAELTRLAVAKRIDAAEQPPAVADLRAVLFGAEEAVVVDERHVARPRAVAACAGT